MKIKILLTILLTSTICFSKTIKKVPSDFFYEVKRIEYEKGIPSQATFSISVLETGWFKSNLCVNHNNYFGIMSKNKGRSFNSMYECLNKFTFLITKSNYYKNAYANRNDCNAFIDNMIYWSELRGKYTSTVKYIANKYEFVPECEIKDNNYYEIKNKEKDIAFEIFNWVTENIEYDYTTFFNPEIANDYTLNTKKTQCKGYAELYKKLCESRGLKCEVVEGRYKYRGYQYGDPISDANRHFWNVVYYSGKPHYVDCTLGAGYLTNNKWVKNYDKYYFDPDPGEFEVTHFPLSRTDLIHNKKLNIHQFQAATLDYWYVVKLSDFVSPMSAEDCLDACERDYVFDFISVYDPKANIYYIGVKFDNRQQAFWMRDYFAEEGFIKPEVIKITKNVGIMYK
jgi:hypothetical protein